MFILFVKLCYSFIENYANFKVKLAWGHIRPKTLNHQGEFLFHLEKNPPTSIITSENTCSESLRKTIMVEVDTQFGRPPARIL